MIQPMPLPAPTAPQPPLRLVPRRSAVITPHVRIPTAVVRNTALSPWARLLFGVISDYHTLPNGCVPGRDRLAEELGCSIPTIERALRELCAAGLIERRQRGHGYTGEYRPITESSSPITRDGARHDLAPSYMTELDPSPITGDALATSPVMGPLKELKPTSVNTTPPQTPPTVHGPPSRAAPNGYVETLGDRIGDVAGFLIELDRNFSVGWVRNQLREFETEIGPLDLSRLKAGLELGCSRFRDRLDRQTPDRPVSNPQGLARLILRDALREHVE